MTADKLATGEAHVMAVPRLQTPNQHQTELLNKQFPRKFFEIVDAKIYLVLRRDVFGYIAAVLSLCYLLLQLIALIVLPQIATLFTLKLFRAIVS